MGKHTPGPWVLKHVSGSNFAVQRFEIRSGSGIPHPIFNKDTSAIDGSTVCISPHDANLIAAAPDLLEALESLLADESREIGHTLVHASDQKKIEAAMAAIAKARGQS